MTLPILFLLAALGAAPASAGPASAVRDEADLFSPDVRRKADEEIAAFRDVYHLPVEIETFAAPPEELRTKIGKMKPANAAPLLHDWAVEQADLATNKGIYVLICAQPGDVEVIVSPETLPRDFTQYDAKRLHSLLKNMKAGSAHVAQRDKRLLEAVAQIREAVRYNLRPPFPWFAVGAVFVGVLGLWGLLSFARRRLRSTEPAEPLRLNLFNALLGGMFGTAAAHWIIDTQFVAASRTSVPLELAATPAPVTEPREPAPETQPDRLDLVARDETFV